MYIDATGHSISSRFVEFWQQHGGAAVFGNPLSEELEELCADNVNRPVQYFETAVLEYHASNEPTWQVLGRHAGKTELSRRHASGDHEALQPVAASASGRFVAETNHSIDEPFRSFYEANGEVRVFGYPISQPLFETGDDGVARQVQYFERAVLEYHDDRLPSLVVPRALGRAEVASTYGTSLEGFPPFQRRNADGSVAAVATSDSPSDQSAHLESETVVTTLGSEGSTVEATLSSDSDPTTSGGSTGGSSMSSV